MSETDIANLKLEIRTLLTEFNKLTDAAQIQINKKLEDQLTKSTDMVDLEKLKDELTTTIKALEDAQGAAEPGAGAQEGEGEGAGAQEGGSRRRKSKKSKTRKTKKGKKRKTRRKTIGKRRKCKKSRK